MRDDPEMKKLRELERGMSASTAPARIKRQAPAPELPGAARRRCSSCSKFFNSSWNAHRRCPVCDKRLADVRDSAGRYTVAGVGGRHSED